ncbi:MAG: MFS transporter, partial [Chloroflexi bacterium]|nr:MFS transporter [Chloroflexota bacterium]
LAYLGDVPRKGEIFLVAHILYIAFVVAFARADSVVLAMAGLILAGVFWSLMQVMANTLFQLAASNEMRGRVMALYSMSSGLQPMGSLPMGFAIERWGAPDTVTVFMVVALLALLAVAAVFPELRRPETPPDVPTYPAAAERAPGRGP